MEQLTIEDELERDMNRNKLVEGYTVIYSDKGYIYLGLAMPWGLAAIGSDTEPILVQFKDLEIVS